jgi:hypothetical protein
VTAITCGLRARSLLLRQGLETPVNKRRDVMTDTSIGNQEEETFLRCDVSDETIEAAAGHTLAGYTLAACTGLSVCEG